LLVRLPGWTITVIHIVQSARRDKVGDTGALSTWRGGQTSTIDFRLSTREAELFPMCTTSNWRDRTHRVAWMDLDWGGSAGQREKWSPSAPIAALLERLGTSFESRSLEADRHAWVGKERSRFPATKSYWNSATRLCFSADANANCKC